MTLRLQCTNKTYTMINVHAPTNQDNKKQSEKTEKFWTKLQTTMYKIPQTDTTILLGDFNAQIGIERMHRKTVGLYPAHKLTNKNGIPLNSANKTTSKLCQHPFENPQETKNMEFACAPPRGISN